MSNFIPYIYLFVAVLLEVIGTTALKSTENFTKLIPTFVMIISYGIAFYFLCLVMKFLPVGVTYAIWSGLGIVLISVISAFYYKEWLDLPAIIGLIFIIVGICIIQLYSKTIAS